MRDVQDGETFRVLGPVEVRQGDRPVPALPPRQRAVLAALLVDVGRVVPVDTLLDRAWDGCPPAAPGVTLQATVSRLRRAIEPGATGGAWELLTTRAPGYLLAADPAGIDAVRFGDAVDTARRLAAGGQWSPAREALRGGLALWRGPAYADVSADFAAQEAVRLEELRLSALELAAELDLQLGRAAELLQQLPALVRSAPLREGLRASLMTALYRCGRQAEALQVYADTRALLDRELGVDPGRALQELHARVLRQDPRLDPSLGLPLDLPLDLPRPGDPESDAPARLVAPRPTTARTCARGRRRVAPRGLQERGKRTASAARHSPAVAAPQGPGGSGERAMQDERAGAEVLAELVRLAADRAPSSGARRLVAPDRRAGSTSRRVRGCPGLRSGAAWQDPPPLQLRGPPGARRAPATPRWPRRSASSPARGRPPGP